MIEGVEFTVSLNEVLVREFDEQPYILNQTHRHIITSEIEYLSDEYPTALEDLERRYYSSKANRMYFEFLIVRQWIKCHLGQNDNLVDIEKKWETQFRSLLLPHARRM